MALASLERLGFTMEINVKRPSTGEEEQYCVPVVF